MFFVDAKMNKAMLIHAVVVAYVYSFKELRRRSLNHDYSSLYGWFIFSIVHVDAIALFVSC